MPIHDIRVAFAPGDRLRRVHLEPEGRELAAERTAGALSADFHGRENNQAFRETRP